MRTLVVSLVISLAVAGVFAWQTVLPAGHAQDAAPPLGERTSTDVARPEFAPGQIVVRYKEGASAQAIAALNSGLGARVEEGLWRSRTQRLTLLAGADLAAAVAAYQRSPLVAEAGRDRIIRAAEAPNDTNFSYQWHLRNTVGGMWAEGAWDLAPNRGQGVVVAVIDTGVAYENFTGPGGLNVQTFVQAPDLAGVTFVSPWDFYNNDDHANDDHGHGSHVTGTIRQSTNDAYGVAGVAHQSTIMPLKVLAYDGSGSGADLNEAIYYAADHGAGVINMSLAFQGSGAPDANGDVCTEIVGLNAALEYAAAHGVVIVAAAGNENAANVACPAAHPSVIATGATRFDGLVSSYSNRGAMLDIAAPGGDGLDQNGDGYSDGVLQETYCSDWFTLLLSGTYDTYCDVFMSGTSMASPHVAGTAALLLGEDPTLTPDAVRALLQSTARERGAAGWDSTYGWGALDARAALAALSGAPPPTPANTPTPTATPSPTNTPTPTPTVTPGGLPDLIESALGNPPSSRRVGQSFTVSDTARNQGVQPAGASTTRFYLSANATWDSSDRLLSGSRAAPGLAAGASSSGSTRLVVPSGTLLGTYFLLACSDDLKVVAESVEGNNCRVSTGTVRIR